MTGDVIGDAIAEARRRAATSDRDLSRSTEHFAGALRSVCERWELTPERWFGGGAGTPTLAVTRSDGVPAVLKLAEPGSLDAAARVMRAANGRGYAAVLAWSAEVGALLLEMLGEHLWSERATMAGQSQVVVPLLREAWQVPLDEGSAVERKAERLSRILADLGPRYGTHHQPAVDQAAIYARELAADERAEVVCHGDPHAGNVLRRADGWALIDPDGFVGERSYDVGVVLRDGCREITSAEAAQRGKGTVLLRQACRHAAELAGVDAERVWRWAYVERVTTGLYLHWHGYPAEAASFLDSALLIDVGLDA